MRKHQPTHLVRKESALSFSGFSNISICNCLLASPEGMRNFKMNMSKQYQFALRRFQVDLKRINQTTFYVQSITHLIAIMCHIFVSAV